ncbi:hypothetical protein DFP72DRAFT_1101049 [Ephemerocybe angulata]|uniref:Uncharacterized protein n=1 Tax=Ephemerocybe angulata TaxID=980116 RepID=A0A8H6I820_9AGAR|nr:hypothetical protein DFP72DRAFT_1101049 [Tulosesus angulatus]
MPIWLQAEDTNSHIYAMPGVASSVVVTARIGIHEPERGAARSIRGAGAVKKKRLGARCERDGRPWEQLTKARCDSQFSPFLLDYWCENAVLYKANRLGNIRGRGFVNLATEMEDREGLIRNRPICAHGSDSTAGTWPAKAYPMEYIGHWLSNYISYIETVLHCSGTRLTPVSPRTPGSKASPGHTKATQLDRDLGYPCEWVGEFSPAAIRGRIMASYVACTKAVCIAVFALAVLYVRYRSQAGSLIRVIRRDGGAYIFAFTGPWPRVL